LDVIGWLWFDGFIDDGTKRMKYRVVLKRTDEGYSVSCPGLPGCWSQGATEAEAIANIRDAIAEYSAAVAATVIGQDVREIDVAD